MCSNKAGAKSAHNEGPQILATVKLNIMTRIEVFGQGRADSANNFILTIETHKHC